MDGKIIVDCK